MKKLTRAPGPNNANSHEELSPVFDVEAMRLYLKIGRSLAYSLCRSGGLPCIRLGGRAIRILREPFLRWLQEGGPERAQGLENAASPGWRDTNSVNDQELKNEGRSRTHLTLK